VAQNLSLGGSPNNALLSVDSHRIPAIFERDIRVLAWASWRGHEPWPCGLR